MRCRLWTRIFRARGGRDAEREERQLWETPERKRSTKPVNGENADVLTV